MKTQNSKENDGATPSMSNPMDIRSYMDSKTVKRKTPDTTPEKHEHPKKHVT